MRKWTKQMKQYRRSMRAKGHQAKQYRTLFHTTEKRNVPTILRHGLGHRDYAYGTDGAFLGTTKQLWRREFGRVGTLARGGTPYGEKKKTGQGSLLKVRIAKRRLTSTMKQWLPDLGLADASTRRGEFTFKGNLNPSAIRKVPRRQHLKMVQRTDRIAERPILQRPTAIKKVKRGIEKLTHHSEYRQRQQIARHLKRLRKKHGTKAVRKTVMRVTKAPRQPFGPRSPLSKFGIRMMRR